MRPMFQDLEGTELLRVDLEPKRDISLEEYGRCETVAYGSIEIRLREKERDEVYALMAAAGKRSAKATEELCFKVLCGWTPEPDCSHSWKHTCISSGHLIECTLCGYEEWYDIKGKRML